MKNLVEYCNEALAKKNAKYMAAEEVSKKIEKYVSELKKNKDYDLDNPYTGDLQIKHGSARIKIERYNSGELLCYPADKIDSFFVPKDSQLQKNTKVLVKFFQTIILASHGHSSFEAADLFDTTNRGDYSTKGSIWYSPDKDQLYDANFKKIAKTGDMKKLRENAGEDLDSFIELFTGFIAAVNPKTQYTKEWFSK